MRRAGNHRGHAIAMLVAAVVTVALLAGCGAGVSATDLAAQDRKAAAREQALNAQYVKLVAQDHVVEAASRVARNHARLVQAIRELWNERGWATTGTSRRIVRGPGAAQAFAASRVQVCSRIGPRGVTKAQRLARRTRELRRRQALYYLNLSCPAA